MPSQAKFQYSDKYFDEHYEYRHVILTPDLAKTLPKGKLLSEDEWRKLGVQQSRGWVHYAIHRPEPHVLLFRRLLTESPTGTHPAAGLDQQNFVSQMQIAHQ